MENIKEFVKSTKLVSRIFMVIWLFMCMLITLSFFSGKFQRKHCFRYCIPSCLLYPFFLLCSLSLQLRLHKRSVQK